MHADACPLPPTLAYGAGFSCTSFSSLNNDCNSNLTAIANEKKTASADTFRGCLETIGRTRPKLILLENVPRIDQPDEDGMLGFTTV